MATKSISFRSRLKRTLEAAFDGAKVKLEPSGTGKTGGFLVWEGFLGKDQIDRQLAVRDAIRMRLSPEELAKVSAILTLTPYELAVMDRD